MNRYLDDFTRRDLLAGAASLGAAGVCASASPAFALLNALDGRDIMKDKRPVVHDNGMLLGAYDPHGDFTNDKGVSTEHLFLPWEDIDLTSIPYADEYARSRDRDVLVTIEPWSWDKGSNIGPDELRRLILSGKRDDNLRAILRVFKDFKSPVTIRWAQEMESTIGRFTWSNWRPDDYMQAYKRMVGIVREELPKSRMMWSPKGVKDLKRYYPGDEYADIVGLSVFGLEAFDKIEFGRPRSFAESVQEGYDSAVGFGKPIWVAELGYEGGPEYLTAWADDVTKSYPQFPELKRVVYFNDKEVWPWPHNLGYPLWRVVRDTSTIPARESAAQRS